MQTMKAAFIEQPGPPESIQIGDLPRPTPGPGQVLVKVNSVAVNPIDTYIRGGAISFELPKPFVVGCDLAGVVEALGEGAERFAPGARVWGTNQGLLGRQGTFAEYACVDEKWLYPTPDGVSDDQAAAMALVGITAHLGLVREARLSDGETIFVNGGSGGVGSTVVQMAKALGARVLCTCGTAEKMEACRALGADVAINYQVEDVAERVAEEAPNGVNLYWETTREPDFDRIVAMMAPRGRIILMAGRDARPPFPVGPFYVKGCSLHGFVMFNATPEEQRFAAGDINRWLAAGTIKPRIDRVMPLDKTAEAHRLQETSTVGGSGAVGGKLVLHP